MQIVVTFNSLDEFEAFRNRTEVISEKDIRAIKMNALVAADEPEKDAVKPVTEEPIPFKEEPEVKATEADRVEVRKILMALNKKTGKNTAKELISSFGVKSLTDVALADIPVLKAKAEEALNG